MLRNCRRKKISIFSGIINFRSWLYLSWDPLFFPSTGCTFNTFIRYSLSISLQRIQLFLKTMLKNYFIFLPVLLITLIWLSGSHHILLQSNRLKTHELLLNINSGVRSFVLSNSLCSRHPPHNDNSTRLHFQSQYPAADASFRFWGQQGEGVDV